MIILHMSITISIKLLISDFFFPTSSETTKHIW